MDLPILKVMVLNLFPCLPGIEIVCNSDKYKVNTKKVLLAITILLLMLLIFLKLEPLFNM